MAKYDCIVVGSCVVDLLCRPVELDKPVGAGTLVRTDPLEIAGGGITNNAGVTMARLGMNVGIYTYVGNDAWGPVIRRILRDEGIDDAPIETRDDDATSTTVVLVDPTGERSFLHCVGAPRKLSAEAMFNRLDLFAESRYVLFGYYSLMPTIEPDLGRLFKAIRAAGCRTALDAAGDGGSMSPLDRILPELDVYIPSLAEAENQTGYRDPAKIIQAYRDCGAPGVLGVKLGTQGVVVSERADELIEVPIATPPGEVIDTTGAGDSFYAGFLTGLAKGLALEDAARLGTAAAACCVTSFGGSTGGKDYATTARIAGLA